MNTTFKYGFDNEMIRAIVPLFESEAEALTFQDNLTTFLKELEDSGKLIKMDIVVISPLELNHELIEDLGEVDEFFIGRNPYVK